MPPSLALLLCIGFVMLLLRLERTEAHGVSRAMWVPTAWILMIASRSLGAWFGIKASNDSGNWLDPLALLSLTVAGIAIISYRGFDWSGTLRRHRWLVVLLGYMLISTFWSEIPLVALKRWVRETIVVVMALVTASERRPREALGSLLRRSAYTLIPLSLVLVKYYPALGRQYGRWSGVEMWTGVTSQKNGLGRLCMISVFFLALAAYRRWRARSAVGRSYQTWADCSVVLIALYLFKGANSSTSLATLVVGVSTFVGLLLLRRLKLTVPRFGLLALVIFLIIFGVSTPFLGASNVASFSSSLGRDETLTGRTVVWAALLPALRQHQVFGYGFGSFWTDARRGLYEIPTAHNGYLDVQLELGEVGLALYTVWMLSCAGQLCRVFSQDYDWASIGISYLVMSLIYNTTESTLNSLTEHMTTVVILFSIVVTSKPLSTLKASRPPRVRPSAAVA